MLILITFPTTLLKNRKLLHLRLKFAFMLSKQFNYLKSVAINNKNFSYYDIDKATKKLSNFLFVLLSPLKTIFPFHSTEMNKLAKVLKRFNVKVILKLVKNFNFLLLNLLFQMRINLDFIIFLIIIVNFSTRSN